MGEKVCWVFTQGKDWSEKGMSHIGREGGREDGKHGRWEGGRVE